MKDLKEPLLGGKAPKEQATMKPHVKNQNKDDEGFRTPPWYG